MKVDIEPKKAFEAAEALMEILPDEVLFQLACKIMSKVYDETCDKAFDLVHQCLENSLSQ